MSCFSPTYSLDFLPDLFLGSVALPSFGTLPLGTPSLSPHTSFTHNQALIFLVSLQMRIKKPEHLIFNLDDINVEGEEGGLMDLEKLRKATVAGPYSHWVGSCNGFICFRSKFGFNLPDPITQEEIVLCFSFQICNPSTREVLVIPSPNVDEDFNCYEHYGFGFDALNNEYKVVCMYNSNKVVMVYTLGTGSWRSIPVPTHMPDHLSFVAEIPVFSDGALHWCTMESEHYNCEFFSFDIHSEELLMIPAPDPIHVMDNRPMFELQGCLCFPGYNESSLDLYKLKKDGNKHYWAKETISVLPGDDVVLSHSKPSVVGFLNSVLLYWIHEGLLTLYNLHMRTKKVIKLLFDFRVFEYQILNHVENLLSLETFIPPGESKVVYVSSGESVEEGETDYQIWPQLVRRKCHFM